MPLILPPAILMLPARYFRHYYSFRHYFRLIAIFIDAIDSSCLPPFRLIFIFAFFDLRHAAIDAAISAAIATPPLLIS